MLVVSKFNVVVGFTYYQVFHKSFNIGFWDLKVGEFLDGVFVYSLSYSGYDSNEGVAFPSMVL